MKYIKHYENESLFKIQDILDKVYWYYKNSQVESILKVEIVDNYKKDSYNREYDYTFLNLNTGKINVVRYDNDLLYKIFQIEDKILRPATPKEIETLIAIEKSDKYNL
jgi:hypothetical protein